MADPEIEGIEFLCGCPAPKAKLVIVADGKRHRFSISEEKMFWALQSVATALRRMNDTSADWPPV